MSGYNSEDISDAGKQQWIAETLDIRREAVDILSFCTSHSGIDNYGVVRVPEPVKELHGAVLAYSDQIRPKAPRLRDGLWDVELSQKLSRPVQVPVDNFRTNDDGQPVEREGYEVGTVDRYGNYEGGDILAEAHREAWSVKPSTLDEVWRANNQVTLTAKIQDGSQIQKRQTTYSVYLPPAASSLLISHFDECLDDMDWLPSGYSQHDAMLDPEGNIHIID